MATLVVSNSLGQFYSLAGDVLWVGAFLLHVLFLISFIAHRVIEFKIEHMVPSWFVPPVGIIVADVAFSGNPALLPHEKVYRGLAGHRSGHSGFGTNDH